MIEENTIRFIGMLNELARRTKNGFIPFSKCIVDKCSNIIMNDFIVYDDCEEVASDDQKKRVVLTTYDNLGRQHIYSYFESYCDIDEKYEVRARKSENGWLITVTTDDLPLSSIEIKDGYWTVW